MFLTIHDLLESFIMMCHDSCGTSIIITSHPPKNIREFSTSPPMRPKEKDQTIFFIKKIGKHEQDLQTSLSDSFSQGEPLL